MRTIKLQISYDGTRFVGWQRQAKGMSVQGLAEAAIEKLTGERVSVTGAGRTDAGVHALGQTASFQTESRLPVKTFAAGLNSFLPLEICVKGAKEVKEGFNARKSAKGKLYMYRLLVSDVREPLLAGRCWQVRGPIDIKAMERAAGRLVGRKDFSCFRASGCGSKSAVRRIEDITIRREAVAHIASRGVKMYRILFKGGGFVRHMVRNIVGTLVEIGKGRLKVADIASILSSKDRKKAGVCAPAEGLYLVRVLY